MGFFSWLFGKREREVSAHPALAAPYGGMLNVNLKTGKTTPVEETDQGKLFAIIASGKCPDCGSTEGFYEGPSGGMSTNIFCANEACKKRFNITPMIGIAERV